ncbi:DNA polymerase III subunit delta [Oscillatoria sp. FACHB-1406]|uniref:DNA polymerase III subunit delta n=1 Tax=Oscillatoria sp. FACHB-1406 TaxID=2692846 RepID=UPI00168693FE|nr:DNA polymerase III subunit delta [Oscillatoria sp. FACHB-1406]
MPTYLFWGEDDFALHREIEKLREEVLDPAWIQFNYEKIAGERAESAIAALNQAMTPPFGTGGRCVWLADTTLTQQCSDALLTELQRTLPAIPETSTFILSSVKKPDGRNKATKLLQKHASIREFSLIPPWKTDELVRKVEEAARTTGVKLTRGAIALLAESVGSNTRQLWNELEKLALWGKNTRSPLDEAIVSRLVAANAHNAYKLADVIRSGNTPQALSLAADLLANNEHPLSLVALLTGRFRTWLLLRLAIDSGEKDESKIAAIAEIPNPKRIYYLRQEIRSLSAQQLLAVPPLLLQLEVSLKRGAEPSAALQTHIIQLCQICRGEAKLE